MNETNQEKISKLRVLQKPVFEQLNLHNPFYSPKMAYIPRGMSEKHIHMFESELKRGCDIYLEFVSSEFISEDPDRTLFRWTYNNYWQEEYQSLEKNGHTRYFIPLSDLEIVARHGKALHIESVAHGDDESIKDMTIKDVAAILWQKPVSNKPWLNSLIKDNFNK
jgi:hypothetical protein